MFAYNNLYIYICLVDLKMIPRKLKICVECGDECYYWARKKCKSCCSKEVKPQKEKKVYVIPKQSKKRIIEDARYRVLRIEFLGKKENHLCPVTNKPTNQVHHMAGRVGTLYLDTRYWLAVSAEGHKKIEENPTWAKEKGFSLDRL